MACFATASDVIHGTFTWRGTFHAVVGRWFFQGIGPDVDATRVSSEIGYSSSGEIDVGPLRLCGSPSTFAYLVVVDSDSPY